MLRLLCVVVVASVLDNHGFGFGGGNVVAMFASAAVFVVMVVYSKPFYFRLSFSNYKKMNDCRALFYTYISDVHINIYLVYRRFNIHV